MLVLDVILVGKYTAYDPFIIKVVLEVLNNILIWICQFFQISAERFIDRVRSTQRMLYIRCILLIYFLFILCVSIIALPTSFYPPALNAAVNSHPQTC